MVFSIRPPPELITQDPRPLLFVQSGYLGEVAPHAVRLPDQAEAGGSAARAVAVAGPWLQG